MWKQVLADRATHSGNRPRNSSIHQIHLMLKELSYQDAKLYRMIRGMIRGKLLCWYSKSLLLCISYWVSRSGRENKYSLDWLWSHKTSPGGIAIFLYSCASSTAHDFILLHKWHACGIIDYRNNHQNSNYSRYSSYV